MNTATGPKNLRAEIQEPVETPDDYGQIVVTPRTVTTVWVSVRQQAGAVPVQESQPQGQVRYKVRLWYHRSLTLTPKMWLAVDGKILRIETVMDIMGRKREWELGCEEVLDVVASGLITHDYRCDFSKAENSQFLAAV